MILPQELRLGNKGWWDEEKQIRYTICMSDFCSLDVFDKVEPIVLTPEILEKCGFKWETDKKTHLQLDLPEQEMNHRNIGFYYKDGEPEIFQMYMDDYFDGYFQCLLPQYLHQLQNLYYSLTGTELKIEL
jgi:hypothetical protein